jgi:hypothetical protein
MKANLKFEIPCILKFLSKKRVSFAAEKRAIVISTVFNASLLILNFSFSIKRHPLSIELFFPHQHIKNGRLFL